MAFFFFFFFTQTILACEKYGTQNGTFGTSKEKVCNLLYLFSIWLLLFLNLKVLGIGHNPGNIIKTVNFKYNSVFREKTDLPNHATHYTVVINKFRNIPANGSWDNMKTHSFWLKFGSLSSAVTLKIRSRSPNLTSSSLCHNVISMQIWLKSANRFMR